MRLIKTAFLGLLLLCACATGSAQAQESVTGMLRILRGDPPPGSGERPRLLYSLRADDGRSFALRIGASTQVGPQGLRAHNGRRVRVTGFVLREPGTDGAPGEIDASAIEPAPGAASRFSDPTPLERRVVSLMCKYADNAAEPRDQAFFATQLSNAYPGFNHYIQEVSYGKITLNNSAAYGWFTLPQPRSFYYDGVKSAQQSLDELAQHCAAAATPTVGSFAGIAGISFMFNGVLDNVAWGGGTVLTLAPDVSPKLWPTAWLPGPANPSDPNDRFGWLTHAIVAHEISHAFGAPHSQTPDGYEYGSAWDVVSAAGANCGAANPWFDATYGCVGQHMNAWAKIIVSAGGAAGEQNFMPDSRNVQYALGSGAQSYTVERLAQPPANANPLVLRFPIAGTTTRLYTIEARRRVGYDQKLPGDGVIIHEIDTTRDAPAKIVPSSAGAAGTTGAIWAVGSVYRNVADRIGIRVDADTGTGYTVTLNPALAGGSRFDISGDAKSDVVWRHADGSNYLWQMNGTALGPNASLLAVADGNWKIVGVGDFDGDGKSDLFWRHEASGQTYVWLMNGAAIANSGSPFTVADLDWKVEGVADFDGDGRSDVLWRHATSGQVFVWQMNGMNIAASGSPYTVADANWKIAALGDLDGDGKADIVWRRDGTGENYAWLMNGTAIAGSGSLLTVTDTNWKLVGAADTDGDGKADLLWRHAASGDNYWWKMNGLTLTTSDAMLAVADLGWQVKGTGDYDGDGKADLLWRHATSGQTYVWLMNGAAFTNTGSPATVADAGWQVQNPR